LAIVSNSLEIPLAVIACVLLADRRVGRLKGVIDAAGVSERSRACQFPEPTLEGFSYAQRTAAAVLHPPPSAPL
jgi:hypothetical protein